MQEQIQGTTMPVLSVHLSPGESVVAEAGEFSWMTDSIQMSTGMGGGAGGTGLMGALKRAVGSSSLLMSTYTARGGPGSVSFAAKMPGSIVPMDVAPGREYLVHRHGFLAGTPGIQISAGFQQTFRTGIFADEDFVLQRLRGQGRAWAELSGEVIPYDLAAGQSLRVHPGHVGMFQASVSFQVVRVPGIANRYFGGDAHYFAVLAGPGTVWLQSMPLPQLAASLVPYLPAAQDRDSHEAVEDGLMGGIVGDLLS
jgi:uncharacterized protein (TIGR00266 family)